MIRVTISQHQDQIKEIRVNGHAETAPYGEDLVCAGVSTIVIGAMNALDEMFTGDCTMQMKDNLILIQVVHSSASLQKALQFLMIQIQTVADQFPEALMIKKKEV